MQHALNEMKTGLAPGPSDVLLQLEFKCCMKYVRVLYEF